MVTNSNSTGIHVLLILLWRLKTFLFKRILFKYFSISHFIKFILLWKVFISLWDLSSGFWDCCSFKQPASEVQKHKTSTFYCQHLLDFYTLHFIKCQCKQWTTGTQFDLTLYINIEMNVSAISRIVQKTNLSFVLHFCVCFWVWRIRLIQR